MNSPRVIKLYGEIHRDDNLLDAYDEIFAIALKDECKTCFIERKANEEQFRDSQIDEYSKLNEADFNIERKVIRNVYRKRLDLRFAMAPSYLAWWSVKTGIKLIHVDHDDFHHTRLALITCAKLLTITKTGNPNIANSFPDICETLSKATVEEYMSYTGANRQYIESSFAEITEEIKDENSFLDALHKERQRRLSKDELAAEAIIKHEDNAPAIVIYGKHHIDSERCNSIPRVLCAQKNIKTLVFHIVGKKVVPRPGEISADGKAVVHPLDEEEAEILNWRGLNYRDARGIPPDEVEASWYFIKAAEKGLAEAQYNLADVCRYGATRNYEKALFWALKAAEQGYVKAYGLLGDIYYKGHGTPKDDTKSSYWHLKAAAAGETVSQATMGYNYLKGEGVPIDLVLAYVWSSLAAKQGDQDGLRNLKFAQKGLTPNQISDAQELLEKWRAAIDFHPTRKPS